MSSCLAPKSRRFLADKEELWGGAEAHRPNAFAEQLAFRLKLLGSGLYHDGLPVHALPHACATHLLAMGRIFGMSKAF